MFEFVTADQNVPFAIALVVMFGIAILEGITALFGAALSNLIDTLLPDLPDGDIALQTDLDPALDGAEPQAPQALSRLLSWLRIGEVPALMLIVVFLTAFGLIGLGLQSFTRASLGFLWPSAVAVIPAFALALPTVRVLGGLLAKALPKDESDALPYDQLVGRVATVTLGVARSGSPAEARVRDAKGTTQYVMVEPDTREAAFAAGVQVLLVRRDGSVFKVIENPNPALVDQ